MSFLSSSSSSLPLASGSSFSMPTLHPIFLKKPSLEQNHELSSNLWRAAKKVGMVAIASIGFGSVYVIGRLKNWSFLPLNKFMGAYSLVCIGFAFLCAEALYSNYTSEKIAYHQKKHQFQLDFRQIQNLGDEQFRAILTNEISLSDEAVDNLLNKASREQIIPSIIKYRKAKNSLDIHEAALKEAVQRKQGLTLDPENKIKDGATSQEIEKAFAALMAEADDFVPTVFNPQIYNIVLKIKMAYIRTIFQSPGYTGDTNELLILGFISPKKSPSDSMFKDDFVKKMLLLSAIDPTYDPIALKHPQTGQTISVKAIARLAKDEKQLESFLFSNPDSFTPRSSSAQKHITAENFEEAFTASDSSPTVSTSPAQPTTTSTALADSTLTDWTVTSATGIKV